LVSVKNLVKYGFVKSNYSKIKAELKEKASSMDEKEAIKYADAEEFEMRRGQPLTMTDYPSPIHRYRIVHETFKQSIEPQYFWIVNYLEYDLDCFIEKVYDLFSASEQSAFFGMAQQRLGLQQDRVSGFLATIGKMVKELFQLVRELRILDERLHYYNDSYDVNSRSRGSAEITLKGIYIDMVEGGAKSTASIYGMARELQFTILPDLFFSTHPITSHDVDGIVDALDFNLKVKEVLKRKLRAFLEWKEHTKDELKTKRVFTLKYLRQHYDIIRMYMDWVRPYLRNIKRLELADRGGSANMINAFEGSLVEIEIIGRRKLKGNSGKFNSIILLHFYYRTMPRMEATQPGEYQHKAPIHFGRNEITTRAYIWTDEQLEAYKSMRADEDLDLLGMVDSSVRVAMDSLGDELKSYLIEAGETFEKPKEKVVKKPGIFSDFFGTFVSTNKNSKHPKKPSKPKEDAWKMEQEKKAHMKDTKTLIWLTYKNYKKAHRMLSW